MKRSGVLLGMATSARGSIGASAASAALGRRGADPGAASGAPASSRGRRRNVSVCGRLRFVVLGLALPVAVVPAHSPVPSVSSSALLPHILRPLLLLIIIVLIIPPPV